MNASSQLPIPRAKAALLPELTSGLDDAALQWLSGYFAGSAALLHGTHRDSAATTASPSIQATVLYGSQTGNGARVAEKLHQAMRKDGKAAKLVRADSYASSELKKEQLLFVVISTQGDGEPPDDARGFFDFLFSRRAPRLDSLNFAVLGLGDSSYPEFCVSGKRVDERLAELGAHRIQELAMADLDVDTVAEPWLHEARQHAAARLDTTNASTATVTALHPHAPEWTRDNPFAAEILLNQSIVAAGNERGVRHLELSLEGSGLSYEPGDALGVWPSQEPRLVQAVLDRLDLDGDAVVEHDSELRSLRYWLSHRRELTVLTRPFLSAHAERGKHGELQPLLESGSRDALAGFLGNRQLLDLLRDHRSDWDASSLVAALRPLVPRLYSIASSQKRVGNEAHLTVAEVHYQYQQQDRWGAASRFLAGRGEGETVPVFIEPNARFRVPDSDRDIIMIGPGTGVAPFRAFIQERHETGAGGRNWLVFGNRHRRNEFLYQLEWQSALKSGALDRIDVAFSRDQAEKVHVQHRLQQRGRELYEWLEGGAHLYVCGDAARMAGDVHATLIEILVKHGGASRDLASEKLNGWLAEGRYSRDVY